MLNQHHPIMQFEKTIRVQYDESYLDGGTKRYQVLNPEDCGLFKVYQDYRLQCQPTHGQFFTRYPENGGEIIASSCIEIVE
jgi:hypothetical protein